MQPTPADLVALLRMLDVTAHADGDQLRLNATRGVLTDDIRAQLSAQKPGILALLREEADPSSTRRRTAPLSFAQRRMWFLDRLQGDVRAYNIPGALRLQGALDTHAFERAVNEIVRRHAVLRTTFELEDGEPVQVVRPSAPIAVDVLDLSAMDDDDRRARVRALAREEGAQPFDLTRGPLLRLRLVRTAPDDHLLLATAHHIVSDGWSMGVFVRELTALYTAFTTGRPSPLAELPLQYADFARWERGPFGAEAAELQLAYWRTQLAMPLPVLDLPLDRPRPPVLRFTGARCDVPMPDGLAARVRTFAEREGVTPFMVLLAAFATLLHRYSGQTDLLIGSPVASRTRLATENLIGFFVNMLPLRVDASGDPPFRELLQRVRSISLDAFANQNVPFERLVEELRPPRDRSRNPIFQAALVVRHTNEVVLPLPGLTATVPELVDAGTSKFDLTATFSERPGVLELSLEYSTDLFDRETIAHMGRAFTVLLGSIVDAPEAPISRLSLLSAAERAERVRGAWNATARPYDTSVRLHELVEAQAARTPGAVALVFDEERLTYAELDARANQLARVLVGKRRRGEVNESTPEGSGSGPELVAVCLHRSVDMVVALLAVLKSGAAYVPIEPDTPRDRLAFLLEDSQARVVLTHEHVRANLPATAANVIALDTDRAAIDAEPVTPLAQPRMQPHVRPLAHATGGDDLAYMIYTSGSTGRPKGALNAHAGIVNRIRWLCEAEPLGADDRVLLKTPFSFDVSVQEFFWTLASGATLVIARPDGHKDPAYLVDTIRAAGITSVHFVPSMLSAFLDHPQVGACTSLRRVLTSGEALSVELHDRFFTRLSCRLRNLYGPTEAAIDVTSWVCAPGTARRSVPIGTPVANTRIHIVDAHLEPVPVGVPGELCIGGVAVGRGYHRRPDLTAQAFVPDPFSDEPGARLYRTGDLARYWSDGVIEFLGRRDSQIKLRGFRIELGEIEAVLSEHESVREAIVVAHADAQQETRLVAYVVPAGTGALSAEALTEAMRPRLPAYMIPQQIIELAEPPRTASGKIDRAALASRDSHRAPPPRAYIEPRTEPERLLAEYCERLLGVERVGAGDDFFALGGHSLLATKVAAWVREEFSVEFPVHAVFEDPTVSAIAARVQRAIDDAALVAAVPAREEMEL